MSGKPELTGQTVVVIGGSSGIGLETARRARAEGADVMLTARDVDRLQRIGRELGAKVAAFDASDFERVARFFDELPTPIDHVLVAGPGPYYAPLTQFDVEKPRRDVHLMKNTAITGATLDIDGGQQLVEVSPLRAADPIHPAVPDKERP